MNWRHISFWTDEVIYGEKLFRNARILKRPDVSSEYSVIAETKYYKKLVKFAHYFSCRENLIQALRNNGCKTFFSSSNYYLWCWPFLILFKVMTVMTILSKYLINNMDGHMMVTTIYEIQIGP